MKKNIVVCMIFLFLLAFPWGVFGVFGAEELTVLFTHDLHSHMETEVTHYKGKKEESGGFAKLKTAIDKAKEEHPRNILVDGGDFSMGTLFQTIYTSEASELRMLGKLGYDATTLGNHEFDYHTQGLTAMLNRALESGDVLPDLLVSNVDWEKTLKNKDLAKEGESLLQTFGNMEVAPYRIYEKDGVAVAVFGLFGENADECAPSSGLLFEDPIKSAKKTVAAIQEENPAAVILCLSHSGTNDNEDKSEDEQLAMAVPAIDVIVSGHTHTTLKKPLVHGKTLIVSAGYHSKNLGSLTISTDGENKVLDYELIPLDETVTNDETVEKSLVPYKERINREYLGEMNVTYDQVIGKTNFDFPTVDDINKGEKEKTLGNLIADSYVHSVEAAEEGKGNTVDVAMVPAGVIRSSFSQGDITTSRIFNVLSLGIGPDEKTGYPLVGIYLKGKDLKNVCEVDASVSDIMPEAKIFISGLSYTYNPNRLFLTRVTEAHLVDGTGKNIVIEDDKLYRVVGDLYSAQMLGAVKDLSYGLLSMTLLDEKGNPVTDIEQQIIYDENDKELKAWEALSNYMISFEKEDDVPVVPVKYENVEGRKIIDDDPSLMAKLSHPNKTTWILVGLIFGGILILVVLIVITVQLVKRHKKKKVE